MVNAVPGRTKIIEFQASKKIGPPRLVAAGPGDRSRRTGDTAAPIHPRQRNQLLGSSTLSTTWITPFDWNTFWIVTLEAPPLASQIVSVLFLASTVSSSPSTVLSLARPPFFLAASIRSFAESRSGTT